MSLVIYADPHIGLNRTKNTTARSRQLLREAVKQQVYDILDRKRPGDSFICLGDLFDTYSNPEQVIRQGQSILYYTDLVLAGNHDVVADADKMGSLELLKVSHGSQVVYTPFGESAAYIQDFEEASVVTVPHVTTQTLFEESLSSAIDLRESHAHGGPAILALHCNYNSPHELTETSLNLEPQHVEELLEVFDYIFLGHEHQPRDLYDGRLIVLGNTHPTGFSDISDKRIAVVDNVGGKLQVNFETIWSDGYVEVDINEAPIPESTDAQFFRLTGRIPSDQLAEVSKGVQLLWRNSPKLLAVKSEVKVVGIDKLTDDGTEITAQSLPKIISEELKSDPPMHALWEEFSQ